MSYKTYFTHERVIFQHAQIKFRQFCIQFVNNLSLKNHMSLRKSGVALKYCKFPLRL